jgi:hypothetical protein
MLVKKDLKQKTPLSSPLKRAAKKQNNFAGKSSIITITFKDPKGNKFT